METRSRHFLDFCIAGFTFWDGICAVQSLKVGDPLEIRAEADNPYDPNAVALYSRDVKLGYIPRDYNAQVSQLLHFGHDIFESNVCQIDLEKHPERQVRVVIRVKDAR